MGITVCCVMQIAVAAVAVLLCAVSAQAAAAPAPLVALDFEAGAANTGTLGGEAVLREHAPGQGPFFGEGLGGFGLRLDRAARSGGPGEDRAGGSIEVAAPALDGLTSFTLAAWFQPVALDPNTRLFYKRGAWDFSTDARAFVFAVVTGGNKRHLAAGKRVAGEGGWEFIALVLDGEAHTARVYQGDAETGILAPAGEAKEVGPPDAVPSPVEIGNLEGIRPFKGGVDRVRIYGAALGDEQVREVFQEGMRSRRTLLQMVQALQPRRGHGPKLSDVCFSTRYQKDAALPVMQAFGATRCEWVYGEKPEFVRAVKAAGCTYGGTINSNVKVPNNEGAARDFDGNPIIAPWMLSWKAIWVTSTHPNTQEALTSWAKRCIDAGADSLQTDDAGLEAASVPWGGDFEATTLRGFGAYLKEHVPAATLAEWGITDTAGFDYREYLKRRWQIADNAALKARLREIPTTPVWKAYLRDGVRRHYAGLRRLLDTYAGRRTPLSMNAYDPQPQADGLFLADFCDYVLAETPTADFARDALRCATVRALGIGYVASPFPRTVAETRMKAAGFYALGALPLAPWDIYMGSDATSIKPRFFGKPEEYADLYRFVRAHADLFDGHESAPVVAILAPVEHYRDVDTHRVVRRLVEAQIPFTFALTGGQEVKFALDAGRLRHVRALVRVNPESDFSEEDRRLLAGLPVGVFSPEQLTGERLAGLAPLRLHAPRGIYAVPRLSADGKERTLVVHLVNTNLNAAGDKMLPQRMLSLTLRPLARLGSNLARATWHEPGAEPKPLEWDESVEGPRLLIPRLAEWGIVSAEFAE